MPFADDRFEDLLPVASQPWPPPIFHPISYELRVWDAFYTGDPDRLSWVFYNLGESSPAGRSFFANTGEPGVPQIRPGQQRAGLLGGVNRYFWGLPVNPGEKRTKIHVPLAADISQTSADLLFSRPPVIKASAGPNQQALDDLMDDGTHGTLLEAMEMCSALGGVYLRTVWDTDLSDSAWLDMVPADAAVPHFSYNKLQAVTFWRVLYDDGSEVVRHTETHIPAANSIVHQVFTGDQTDLGQPRPLTDFQETQPIARYLTEGSAITFPDQPRDASTVVYIPNIRPNRIWRQLGPQAVPLGRSDYSGTEALMDSLDEAYSSWQRDIQLAKMRLIVPQQYLDNIGRGKGAVFEPDREVYSPVSNLTTGGSVSSDIVANQFTIRYQEHAQTVSDLINRIVGGAGYSAQTFGEYEQGGGNITATEIEQRERRSLITRDKKILYVRPGLRDILYGWLSVQQSQFGRDVTPERPELEFGEPVLPDQLELAQTAAALAQAEAASKQTLVSLVHPDWTDAEIQQEVARIYQETGLDLAGRARITIAPPMNSTATIAQEVQQLAEASKPPNLPDNVPASTGDME